VAIGMGIMVSVSALLLEELSFHTYRKPGQLAWLLGAVIMENCGYRQLVAVWRLAGLIRWATTARTRRGVGTKSAVWQHQRQRPTPRSSSERRP
jgi:hypothetical protein